MAIAAAYPERAPQNHDLPRFLKSIPRKIEAKIRRALPTLWEDLVKEPVAKRFKSISATTARTMNQYARLQAAGGIGDGSAAGEQWRAIAP